MFHCEYLKDAYITKTKSEITELKHNKQFSVRVVFASRTDIVFVCCIFFVAGC